MTGQRDPFDIQCFVVFNTGDYTYVISLINYILFNFLLIKCYVTLYQRVFKSFLVIVFERFLSDYYEATLLRSFLLVYVNKCHSKTE